MGLNKAALKLREEDRSKLEEIFRTARNSDSDKDMIRDYLEFETGSGRGNPKLYMALGAAAGFLAGATYGTMNKFPLARTSYWAFHSGINELLCGIAGATLGVVLGIVPYTLIGMRAKEHYDVQYRDALKNKKKG